jgi:hypothetical protein
MTKFSLPFISHNVCTLLDFVFLFYFFLQTKNWVVDTVLERISQADRSVVFGQLLRLAEVSARVFNFNSAFNILSGLRYLHFPRRDYVPSTKYLHM